MIKRVLRHLWWQVKGSPKFRRDRRLYKKSNTRPEFKYLRKNKYPIKSDYFRQAGDIGVYFFQDLWAAQKIQKANPKTHYDIGSRVDGFILALLSFRKVTLIDIRPLDIKVEGLDFIQSDATNLENIPDGTIESISSLCVYEHFGLGRYGDPVDPEACFKGFKALQSKIAKGGRLYISVPIAKQSRLEFNAHRIFNPQEVIAEFDQMKLVELKTASPSAIIENDDMSWDDGRTSLYFGLFEFLKVK